MGELNSQLVQPLTFVLQPPPLAAQFVQLGFERRGVAVQVECESKL
jgi:hypothetical protein